MQLSEFGEVKGRVKGLQENNHKTLNTLLQCNKKKYTLVLYLQTIAKGAC